MGLADLPYARIIVDCGRFGAEKRKIGAQFRIDIFEIPVSLGTQSSHIFFDSWWSSLDTLALKGPSGKLDVL